MKEPKAVLLIFLLLFFSVIIQSTFHFLWILNVHPDLCLLIIVFVAVRRGPLAGMLTGFTAGLLGGFFIRPYGFYALVNTVLGYILGRFEGVVSLDSVVMRLVLVAGATLAKGLLSGVAHLVFGIPGQPILIFIGETFFECLYNIVLTLPVFFLLKIMNLFKTKPMEQF